MTEHPLQWTPSARELDDLELLIGGYLPDEGFGPPGPGALTLTVSGDAAAADELELLDPEGLPLARLQVRARHTTEHGTALEGPLRALTEAEHGPFRSYRRPPGAVRPGGTAVPVDRPLTETDVAELAGLDGPLTLVALAGHGTRRPVTAAGLIRTTVAAAALLPDAEAVAAPVAERPDPADDPAFEDRVVGRYGRVRRMAAPTGELPAAVAAALGAESLDRAERGLVVFFTGLSGSGKSTLARALHDHLLERGDRTVTSLDGDIVRHHLSKGLTFSKEDRETNIARIGWVAAEISRHHGVAICSPIAPFESTRAYVRSMVAEARAGFFLVHVATPLEECERRDRKGLYAKARAGLIPEFTGISSPYEEPTDPELRIDTTGRSIDDCLADVLAALDDGGWLRSI